jgi:hypothetical protein
MRQSGSVLKIGDELIAKPRIAKNFIAILGY